MTFTFSVCLSYLFNSFIHCETDALCHKWENPGEQCFVSMCRAGEEMESVYSCL